MPQALDHIAPIRKNCPDVRIVVDGGVNATTIDAIRGAGVHEVVAGSAVTDADSLKNAILLRI
jgi:pentose-5-phosphate-3-epimerase